MKNNYIEMFLKNFRESPNFKGLMAAYRPLLGKPVWQVVGKARKELALFKAEARRSCEVLKTAPSWKQRGCIKLFHKVIKVAEEKGSTQRFSCHDGFNGFCLPLKLGNQIYGHIIVCHLQKEVSQQILPIFESSIQTLMRAVQKELELKKVYDTIRPRAIALSTVHTVHRLISSTLDLEELLPRIARLCLQAMRARKCSILMLDQLKKVLVNKATVYSQKKEVKPGKRLLLVGPEGRVIKSGASVLEPKRLLVPLIDEDVIGIIKVTEKVGGGSFTTFDQEILTTFAEQAVIAIRNARLYQEQERLTIGSIRSLATILDTRAPHIYTHSTAFAKLVLAIAKELKIHRAEANAIRSAALLHDAGKIMVPEEILKKPRGLTGKEYKIIKEHPVMGAKIVKPLDALKPVIPIILHHHERFDGKGYPKGLKGQQIPMGARIMAVADTFLAMVSKRPYRPALTIEEAVAEIKRHSGTQFDPEVVKAFLRTVAKGKVKSLIGEIRKVGY